MIYLDLRRDIEGACGNFDPVFLQSIDRFIRQAESSIGMMVELPNYQKLGSVTWAANNNTVNLTSFLPGFISIDDLTLPGYGIIEKKDYGWIAEAYPDGSEKGPPRYFGMQDDVSIIIGPTPDITYTCNSHFFAKWPSIVDLGHDPNSLTRKTETFISSKFETALLNMSLYFANLWMKDFTASAAFKEVATDNLPLIAKYAKGKAKKPNQERTNNANDGVAE